MEDLRYIAGQAYLRWQPSPCFSLSSISISCARSSFSSMAESYKFPEYADKLEKAAERVRQGSKRAECCTRREPKPKLGNKIRHKPSLGDGSQAVGKK